LVSSATPAEAPGRISPTGEQRKSPSPPKGKRATYAIIDFALPGPLWVTPRPRGVHTTAGGTCFWGILHQGFPHRQSLVFVSGGPATGRGTIGALTQLMLHNSGTGSGSKCLLPLGPKVLRLGTYDVTEPLTSAQDLLAHRFGAFGTILADPPWRFSNRTGKIAPEYAGRARYGSLALHEIAELPVNELALPQSHLYLWVPNALVAEGLDVMRQWGFEYKTNLVWYKIRKDGGPDGRGVGFYFRNVTELVLFGVRGSLRTRTAGRTQVNLLASRKREHSRKPDELHDIIEQCSPGPYIELFARHIRQGWDHWGNGLP